MDLSPHSANINKLHAQFASTLLNIAKKLGCSFLISSMVGFFGSPALLLSFSAALARFLRSASMGSSSSSISSSSSESVASSSSSRSWRSSYSSVSTNSLVQPGANKKSRGTYLVKPKVAALEACHAAEHRIRLIASTRHLLPRLVLMPLLASGLPFDQTVDLPDSFAPVDDARVHGTLE